MLRRRLALLAFVTIVAASVDFALLHRVFFQNEQLRFDLRLTPDRGLWFPEYVRFLAAVGSRTSRGDSIAIAVPALQWEYGYAYAYYRASYVLAGREVLPLITPADRFLRQNLKEATYVAAWESRLRTTRPVVWRGHGGVLFGR